MNLIKFSTTEGTILTHEVKWNDTLCCITIGDMPYHKLFDSAYIQPSILQFEIIGNIFDLPEDNSTYLSH